MWDRDDCIPLGRFAYDTGLTLTEALTHARDAGIPERWLPDIEIGYRRARESAINSL